MPDGQLHAFVLEAGRALSLAGAPVGETQERLARIAGAGGAGGARVVVLPTALVLALDPAGPATVESVPQLTGALRLDQISAVYEVVRRAERGAVAPAEGLCRLRAVRAMRPRHGPAVTVLGYLVMTVGLCLLLRPAPREVALAAVLGGLVGGLRLLAAGHRTVSVLIPVIAATAVSALTFVAVRHGLADPGLRTLVAPLVAFLPGGVLTTGTIELASGEMVAGAGRLVFGALQLLLLTFGIVAGALLAGLPGAEVLRDNPGDLLGWWARWLGVALFGVAVAVYFSAPRGVLGWLMVVLCVAWLGQLAGEWLLGTAGSGFVGALAMTPVALAVSRLPTGPPAQVTFLPAFWLLAPGAVGLIGVTESVANPAESGLENLVPPLASILAIALGVLCGSSVYSGLEAVMSENRAAVFFSAGPSRWWRIGLGALTAATGVLVLVWPDVAVLTLAVIVGLHLVVAGVVRAVTALPAEGATRVLYLLLGLLLFVVGIVCLFSPAVLVLLFGLSWLVNGGIELFHGVTGGGGWTVAAGAVSLVAGVVCSPTRPPPPGR